jgi:two-component system, NtrC family, nitrogen regulation sensor histidine kinase NtrY
MIFRSFETGIFIRVSLLFGSLTTAAYCVLNTPATYFIIVAIVVIFQLGELIKYITKTNTELAQFVLAVRYRDFSQHFNERDAPVSVKQLRRAFNEINTTFKRLSNEKEAQYQYLQTILELVDTGILSFDANGEVEWMNESLKKLIHVPYLKNVHSLAKRDEHLHQTITSLKIGESKLTTIQIGKTSTQVLLSATAFRTGDKLSTLIAFQNVNVAVEETETQAWQKLLRVMTHEIMNSVAPISSLADTLKKRLQMEVAGQGNRTPDPDLLEDVTLGVDVIRNRSEGLLKFAETYRNLSKITNPELSKIYVRDLFEGIYQLMQYGLEQKGIEMDIVMKDPHLTLQADPHLIEQVLINLVLNAAEAVKEREEPKVQLSAFINENEHVTIEVADNGTGIPPDVAANIFVPFFTTKKNGSGIGLSLSKQIMQLHKGSIHVQSVEGQGSVFRLQF